MKPSQDTETDVDATAAAITVSGHQVDVGDGLTEHATNQLQSVAAKYFGGAETIAVTFSRTGKGGFGCAIRVHTGKNLFFDGEADHADAYAAFNMALEHVAKQLRRRKRELREDKPVNPTKQSLL
jgi:ribosomal subunit interface protein